MFYDQSEYNIRCEWGLDGVTRLSGGCDAVVIVDVLSFSTCVDVAVARGAVVYPYLWGEEAPEEFAARVGATIAGRNRGDTGRYTLSPVSLSSIPSGTGLVLPSPNGSTLSLSTGDKPTFAGSLRNARSVAQAALEVGRNVLVVPAGERWDNGSLRPAVEDLIGAGAIISYMVEYAMLSPEARAALAAFEIARDKLHETLAASGSGRELIERGFAGDVAMAADLSCSECAPRLLDGAYRRS